MNFKAINAVFIETCSFYRNLQFLSKLAVFIETWTRRNTIILNISYSHLTHAPYSTAERPFLPSTLIQLQPSHPSTFNLERGNKMCVDESSKNLIFFRKRSFFEKMWKWMRLQCNKRKCKMILKQINTAHCMSWYWKFCRTFF